MPNPLEMNLLHLVCGLGLAAIAGAVAWACVAIWEETEDVAEWLQ